MGCSGPAPPNCIGTKAAAPSPAPGAPLPQTRFHYSGTVIDRKFTSSVPLMHFIPSLFALENATNKNDVIDICEELLSL